MSNFNTTNTTPRPRLSTSAAPLARTTTMLPATGTGLMGHNDHHHHLSKQERKALKHGHGVTGASMPLAGAAAGTGLGTAMRGATTSVVEHQPIVEREVVVERPVEVRREHHIQPVIHEREHRIQPTIKTQITTERRVLEQDRTTMLPPVVEKPLMGAALTGTTGLSAHQHQPLATTAGAHHGGGVGALEAERRLSTTAGATTLPGERYGTTGTTTTGHHHEQQHSTVGQKIKGTAKELAGTITRNPVKKEEGRMLKHGMADPAMAATHPTGTRI
ncbi:uncharacterized protein ACA1_143730 [Acanthamoeba castellanii str. Neff]|uniref:Uncharacterized protein n=1 Tax=Acanthamoeba castellanii (strain ATCC 30010 / Neff) TaxID=1257118 RepID=L8HH21_ACACF|nr:uncharacterized protein ACA1_143730 [Acanthamoeba castellanii str. Neff]ELR23993.1 hypothetical protein ACA1_143730 [Acanthamoeba castellanii str. Neff]